MSNQTTTPPVPNRDNYLLALAALAAVLSRKQAREVNKASFVRKYEIDPDTIRALVQLDCLEQDKAKPGQYRALENLFHVTPEQVMERLALMKEQPEAQPAKVATKLVDDKPAKQPRAKKAAPVAFFTPEPTPQTAEPIRETYSVQVPTDAELAAVAEEVSERLAVTINKVVGESEPEPVTAACAEESEAERVMGELKDMANKPNWRWSETLHCLIDATGTYIYNWESNAIERADGKPVSLGDVCTQEWKEFAENCFPKKDEKERVCAPYPTADQLLSDDRPPVNKVDFIQRLYDLKRLYQKASYAVTELAVILSEIDDMEEQNQ